MTTNAPRLDRDRAARAIAELLLAIGEDPARPGLARTPQRVAEAAAELLGGIGVDPVPALRAGRFPVPVAPFGTFPAGGPDASGTPGWDPNSGESREAYEARAQSARDQPVLVRGASFRSMCEHHLLPFTGTVHLAYVPSADIVGLGRLYDLVETVSTRLTLQERIGDEIVDALMAGLDARGAIAVIEATHGCVGLRGSRQERGETVTIAARGTLAEAAGRAEIMALLTGPVFRGAPDADVTSRDGIVRGRLSRPTGM